MLKTITIKNLTIQFDGKGENPLAEAHEVIDLINKIVGMSELESQPQIFSGAVDNSDIEIKDETLNEE